MTLPYSLRLLCLCLGAFFIVHLALSAIARAIAPWIFRAASRMGARRPASPAALLVLALRLAPAAFSLAAVTALCLPSFLSFEIDRGPEAAGVPFLAAAALGASIWTISLVRGARALARSHSSLPRGAPMPGDGGQSVALWDAAAPFLGLAGVIRPRVLVSRSVASVLEPEQLAAALRHEEAHRAAADNWKRLLLLLTPDALPGLPLLRAADRAWARFAEWAADDWAVAQDARCSLALAEALVRVARLGASAEPSPLVSPFTAADEDISLRVERLLNVEARIATRSRTAGWSAAILCSVPFLITAAAPGALSSVHELLERLMH
jgi:Zn-dependent protease with chaperone function